MTSSWTLAYSRDFVKELEDLRRAGRKDVIRRALRGLEMLREDPFTPRSGVDIKRLQGRSGRTYRLRVGDYRIVYEVDASDLQIQVTMIRPRGAGFQ